MNDCSALVIVKRRRSVLTVGATVLRFFDDNLTSTSLG
jgi:hypothetical protein